MSRKSTLLKNIFIYGAGTSLSKLLSILLVGLYTAYIAPEHYGYYDVLITTIAALTPIITLQIIDALYRHLLDADSDEANRRAVTSAFFVVITGLTAAVTVLTVLNLVTDIRLGWYLIPYTTTTVLFSFSQQTARGLRRNMIYAMSGITYTGVMLLANVVLIVFAGLGVEALLLSIMIADLFGIIFIEISVGTYRRVRPKSFSKQVFRDMCRYSIPLLPSAVTWWLLMLISRYAILYAIGPDANGIYAAAAKFPSLLMTIFGIFALAWQENAILEYNAEDRNEYFTKTFRLYVRLLGSTLLLLLPITRAVVGFLIDDAYYEAWRYVPFLYLGSMFQAFSNFYLTSYMGAKKTMGAFTTTLAGVVAGVAVCLCAIPHLGIQAASLGHMAAFLLMWLTRLRGTRRFVRIQLEMPPLLLLTSLAVLYTICYYLTLPWLDILLLTAAVPLFLWLNRETLGLLIRMAQNLIAKRKEPKT